MMSKARFAINRASATFLTLLFFGSGQIPRLVAKDFEVDGAELEQMQRETKLALKNLDIYHYSQKSIHNLDAEELLTSFMKDLDYNHLFFLQTDLEDISLRFNRTLIDVYLQRGQLHPAFQIFKIYRKRALARLDWVFERLKGDFDFNTDMTFVPDRSELDWPENREEADQLWEKRLTYDLLQEILNDETPERAKEKVTRRFIRTKRYIEELDPENIEELFLTSVAQLYDPHSTFLSYDSLDDFSISMRNSLVGIGALLRDEDGYCIIQELISGGPADMSNRLYPGDKIIEVGQEEENPVDVIDMKLRKIVDLIRGEKGTKVNLTVIPGNATDPSERKFITLVRDEIKLTENLAHAEIYDLPNGPDQTVPIGVIELPSFYGSSGDKDGHPESSTTRDVEELVRKLEKAGIEGLVLDLSRNGGGLLNEAIDLTGLFIPKGPVVQVKDTTGKIREDWDYNPKIDYEGPMVVLVSRRSASASEIVAGALQNHRRAIIVGDSSTHGKGTVQAIFELDRSFYPSPFRRKKTEKFGATKITIQKFYLPNGDSTQNKGVQSDIVLPSINEFLPIGESDLPNALVWDTIDPLNWNPKDTLAPHGYRIDAPLLDFLREKSEERLHSLEEFSYLKRNINWFEEKQEQTEFSLNLKSRRIQRNLDNQFKKEMDSILNDLNRNRYPERKVLLDVSKKRKIEHQRQLRNSKLPNGKLKANAYYQKVFFYQPEKNVEIEEVWVENFDYEKLLEKSAEIARFLSETAKTKLDEDKVKALLQYFKTAETSDEFKVEQAFASYLGDQLEADAIDALIPSFFTKLIELDPEILKNKSSLNIPLREGMRVLVDWLQYEKSPLHKSTIVSNTAEKK